MRYVNTDTFIKCDYCGKKALFTVRLDGSPATHEVKTCKLHVGYKNTNLIRRYIMSMFPFTDYRVDEKLIKLLTQ